jgi:uncharacterized repeat protein (TIGR03837 family)
MPLTSATKPLRWSVFCQVIDNHGDLGVCWRLSVNLAQRGQQVTLWLDDASALAWLCPQGHEGVTVLSWPANATVDELDLGLTPRDEPHALPEPHTLGDVVIEAFGCELPSRVQAAIARSTVPPLWLNLEHLSAEGFVERNHRLPSPVMAGPAKGLTKHFFYPGFTKATGGLLRETDLPLRMAQFDRRHYLAQWGVGDPDQTGERVVALFCYEPAALPACLQQWAQLHANDQGQPIRLLVTAGRARAAVAAVLLRHGVIQSADEWGSTPLQWGHLSVQALPYLTQEEFDHLLWASDFNFVRGEDSMVRALWAGQPLIWQIYVQDDGAHHDKLDAFLERALSAPEWMKAFYAAWNVDLVASDAASLAKVEASLDWLALLRELSAPWLLHQQKLREQLLTHDDLAQQLLAFSLERL